MQKLHRGWIIINNVEIYNYTLSHFSDSTVHVHTRVAAAATFRFQTASFAASDICKQCRMQRPVRGTTCVVVVCPLCSHISLYFSALTIPVRTLWERDTPRFLFQPRATETWCGALCGERVWTQTMLAEKWNKIFAFCNQLKTFQVGRWQDGWARSQIWNHSDPAARLVYFHIGAFCFSKTVEMKK